MTKRHNPGFPAWLDRARKADSRRYAKMTPEEVAADINRRGRQAAEGYAERRGTPPHALRQRKRAP